ncbi:MAG: reverse transcriptase domain-containing protein, partial [Bacteroidota bacterium]
MLRCPVTNCEWEYPCDFDKSQSFEIVKMHVSACHERQPGTVTATAIQSKAPKIDRPVVDLGIDQEAWNMFLVKWEHFGIGTRISDEDKPLQLLQCASQPLSKLLVQADRAIVSRSVEQILSSMESFAVIKVSKGTQRAELMKLSQNNDEAIRTFAARVKGKAQTCGFVALGRCACPCNETVSVDYTQEVIKDVIIAGISDTDIRTSVLETEGIEDRSLADVISIVERKERARKAYKPLEVSGISQFKRKQRNSSFPSRGKDQAAQSNKVPCAQCKQMFNPYSGRNAVPYKMCFQCFKNTRRSGKNKSKSVVSANNFSDEEVVAQHSVVLGHEAECIGANRRVLKDHPRVSLQIGSLDGHIMTTVNAIADTGAQSNLWGLQDFQNHGFKREHLRSVDLKLSAANKNPLNVIGGFNARFEGRSPSNEPVSCEGMVYVSDSVTGFFLSYTTMIGLSIIDNTFPTVGSCIVEAEASPAGKAPESEVPLDPEIAMAVSIRSINSGCMQNSDDESPCDCPQRSAVPMLPKKLPFAPTAHNNKKMKDWLLNRYASSTFNTCPHRPLQQMAGPPVTIHMDDSAEPRVYHTPVPVPIHWQQKVKEDLQRDVSLGILEPVPHGVPVTWCHRMVVTRKHDGTPRRTVDLSPLNKFCKRETFSSESPFHLARRIPKGTWKTVSDAWNGYHSVPLRKADRHLTTFITPFGRYRYTRTPQGYLSSGDCYNRRFDEILSEFMDKERCVDDTIHYDVDLEKHWWRTLEFLNLVGSSGVVLNPDKFQFAERCVDFAGFRISDETIKPLPRYTDAITQFPTPLNRTDVKSWFGLVNQVSNYAQLRDVMAPFRHLLSPKNKFIWDDDLQKSFERSKRLIVEMIQHGVEIFDLEKVTCLRLDWSEKGLGYFLLQKHCACPGQDLTCCKQGWKITLAGSRFLTTAEQNYAAVEGEALAVAWGLEHTRYFTQGCKDLILVTDHKPLVKIFSDRALDEITNTRLFRLKQRTLPWTFSIRYLP